MICKCLIVYIVCIARRFVTKMVLAVSLCVHSAIKTVHIGVCGATACILGSHIFLRIMQLLFLLHSWPSGVSSHYEQFIVS